MTERTHPCHRDDLMEMIGPRRRIKFKLSINDQNRNMVSAISARLKHISECSEELIGEICVWEDARRISRSKTRFV